MSIALYPGSFDPVTNGHLDIAERASHIFDTIVMAVFDRPDNKRLLFSTAQRVDFLRQATAHMPKIRIETYSTLTVTYAKSIGAGVIVRGLRAANDFEAEFQMAQVNQRLAPDIDLVYFMASHQYTYFSSTRVRELASLGADVSWLVPPHVVDALHRVYADRRHGG
ncbi:MAG: pantetheine-phosphate adenylyltransferase [Roseiflexaceae bacterium]|jgi:pantetheine-phosphate adenylyltransferase|nr:pantetheine-phosphate adenylyltransferase [Chloroflexaceae bacterium]MCE2852596.1 pantetheine-phosphate adenylyltransferase [Chloroflexaceae bacterium]